MSAANDCACSCENPAVVEVPGTNGVSSFTTVTNETGFTVPAVDGSVVVGVVQNSWMALGQIIFMSDGANFGFFRVDDLFGTTGILATNLGYEGMASPSDTIGFGAKVTSGGTQGPDGGLTTAQLKALNTTLLLGITALTDSSTGTASNTIAAGVGVQTIQFQHTFIGGTAAAEPVTNYTPGFAFKILKWASVTDLLLVGASGSRVANMEINSTDVGTVPSTITVAIANAAVGTVTAGTTVAGANTGSATDTISIEIANGGTAFSAGSVTFIITLQNMDSANAVASLADHVNDMLSQLQT